MDSQWSGNEPNSPQRTKRATAIMPGLPPSFNFLVFPFNFLPSIPPSSSSSSSPCPFFPKNTPKSNNPPKKKRTKHKPKWPNGMLIAPRGVTTQGDLRVCHRPHVALRPGHVEDLRRRRRGGGGRTSDLQAVEAGVREVAWCFVWWYLGGVSR